MMLGRVDPQTIRPPKGGLSSIGEFAIEENLERAKGLEPSTPTLARSVWPAFFFFPAIARYR
jgi:hypothetical protein